MSEREPVPAAAPTEAPARPPYERVSAGLARLLASTGWTVQEGFPAFMPRGALHASDHAAKTLTLHPWIAPRARAEVLLREGVTRLAEQPTKKRGHQHEDGPRSWLVEGLVGKHTAWSSTPPTPATTPPGAPRSPRNCWSSGS